MRWQVQEMVYSTSGGWLDARQRPGTFNTQQDTVKMIRDGVFGVGQGGVRTFAPGGTLDMTLSVAAAAAGVGPTGVRLQDSMTRAQASSQGLASGIRAYNLRNPAVQYPYVPKPRDTVWSRIKPTQEVWPGTEVPRSFELAT